MARRADRFALYQASVQQPVDDVRFFDRVFKARFGRRPLVLREDFCGAGLVACTWARSHRERRAYGVDLDRRVLAWGALHNVLPLPVAARARVQLIQGDVLDVRTPRADIVVAGNFSFCIFTTRDQLRRYFRSARRNLATEGLLVLDVLGGSDTQQEDHEETRPIDRRFRYVWEQKRFDPLRNRGVFAIHFRFKDGSELRNAFRYDWRLWTIPELQELLLEAGFSAVDVYWEGTDRASGEGNGIFKRVASAPADDCWIAELVATR